MDTVPYKLLVVDTENSAVLLTDGESGEIVREWPFPGEYSPVDIQLISDSTIAYIPAINSQGRGTLFSIFLPAGQLTQLPLDLPPIERFAAGPQLGQAVVATRDGALFLLDVEKRSLTLFGRSGEPTACVGLATDNSAVYTVWQHEGNGVLAVFSPDGQLREERFLPGLPTNLSQSERYLYVPFTATGAGEEGMLLLLKQFTEAPPTIISLHHCPSEAAFRIYPCHVTVTPDETTAYVVHEDSANVSVIDIASAAVSGYIPVGRSLSCLTLVPDSKFAVAGSYMFADLSLIDLVNRRLLSLTDGERELFGQVAVLP
jgi:YVTN family beta-propeller protein